MADNRDRSNVLLGAPDVMASGGLLLGEAQKDATNFPTDATAALPSALKLLPAGFIGEDGITKTVDRSTEKIKDWNKDSVIVLETDHSVTVKLTFLEAANANVLKTVYGESNVTIASGKVSIADSAGELPHFCLAAEMNGGNGKKGRIFIPDGQVTSVGEITFKKDGIIQYEVEIECFGVENKKFIAYFDVPAAAGAAAAKAGAPGA